MNVRPTSVTVVAWLLIVANVFVLFCEVLWLNDPQMRALMANRSLLPVPVSYFMTFGGLSLMIASGIGMLRGHNWARFLYVIWYVISFLISVITVTTSMITLRMIPGYVVFLCFVFFLFRPKANQFFLATEPLDRPQGETVKTTRTVLIVIALLFLPFILALILFGYDLFWGWLFRVAVKQGP